jgi:hypothetical protein
MINTAFAPVELELIQAHTAQKPLLWVEVGALAVRKRSECAGVVWAAAFFVWPRLSALAQGIHRKCRIPTFFILF